MIWWRYREYELLCVGFVSGERDGMAAKLFYVLCGEALETCRDQVSLYSGGSSKGSLFARVVMKVKAEGVCLVLRLTGGWLDTRQPA